MNFIKKIQKKLPLVKMAIKKCLSVYIQINITNNKK